MGNKLDDVATSNFIKYYVDYLIKNLDEGTDYFDEWIIAMHGKFVSGEKALLDQIIDDFGHCARDASSNSTKPSTAPSRIGTT